MDSFERAKSLFVAGNEALAAGRGEEAEAAFAASLAALPDRVSTLLNLGLARLRLGRAAAALEVLERAARLAPDDADAWTHQGEALVALGRPDEALACHERALALDAGRAVDLFRRGVVLLQLGRHDAALTAFERARDANPGAAEAWFRIGQTLQVLARHDESLPAYEQALRLDPGHAQAWSNVGGIERERGDYAAAAAAYAQAIEHGGDTSLNRYFLAAVQSGDETPPAPPRPYVESLFDDYASSFDQHLVDELGYRGHRAVVAGLPALPSHAARVLDLGCGTGLCAPLLKPLARRLVGVDLSARMLERAASLGLYDALHHAELVEFLAGTDERFEVVVAADVFIYVGRLEPSFAAIRRVIADGGWFAFSIEPSPDSSADFALLPSLRYAHSTRYVDALAERHGFAVVSSALAPIREEQARALPALYVVLRAAPAAA